MILSARPHIRRLFSSTCAIARSEYGDLCRFGSDPELLPVKSHFPVSLVESNSRLKELIRTDRLNDARDLFDGMAQRDEISWTTIISGYVNSSRVVEALSLFLRVWVEPNLRMDPFVLSLALKACGLDMNADFGDSLHGYSAKTGFVYSVFVGSALLDMYMKTGRVLLGCRVFDEMLLRNVVSWTAIITGLVRSGRCREGLDYFSDMWASKQQCDSYTFAIALKACADSGNLNVGREIHSLVVKRGFDSTSYVSNTLATLYNKCGKLDYGLRLFERIETKDVVSWTTIITSYVQMGQEDEAVRAFLRMRESGVDANEYTFAAVISGCAGLARIKWGEQLHAHVMKKGVLGSLSVANSTMTMYSKCGELDSTLAIFQEMHLRDVVSWSTIIASYSQAGIGEEAFELLLRMRKEGPKPTEFALASVLSVCGNMAILEQGKQIHAHVLQIGIEHRAMIQSGLINMYAKCGSITEASKIFNVSMMNDIISWTAMINGYAEHGLSFEAINLFERLHDVGLRPDAVTYIGVLTACSHAGLVDLAFCYFKAMTECYRIHPTKEHYGCMIDLLCRAGRLSEAESMIENMPFHRDDVVWSTLLRACRAHGDVDRGRRAAEQILEMDPNCAGTHITLANMYSAQGRWRDAAHVRKLMRAKGVMKEPGWSLIKMKDCVFTFVAGDRTHLQSEEIYYALDMLGLGENEFDDTDLILDVLED
ncbi:hypothetical protein CDL15_Pgr005223 [Punica granatum]|uniref:Pentatricopeptide repeat-containing protein At3g47840 n=1 Tax=Punica granatum TaxID=22663 RepID=A0A218WPV1_PUNGR|nr:hypothetical protein CDL15_Pgr005223 [Punica granatum]